MDKLVANPKNPGHRTKASKIRTRIRAGAQVTPEEAAWLADYEEEQRRPKDVGGSRSERIINIEERSEAVGTGAAAEVAAAAAMTREEGRRLDYLLQGSVNALMKAVETYKSVTETLLERTLAMEEVHMGMLGTIREQYIARTQAEVDAIAQGAKENDNALLNELGSALIGQLTKAPKKGP